MADLKMRSGISPPEVCKSGERWLVTDVTAVAPTGCGPGISGRENAELAIAIKLADSCYKSVKIKGLFRLSPQSVLQTPITHCGKIADLSLDVIAFLKIRDLFGMAISSERGKSGFRRMERSLQGISSDLDPDSIHNFRTMSRRLQTLFQELLPERSRNQKKLLQLLNPIRKRAGRVRDIDVQLAALRSLKTSQEPRRKTQLMQSLIELRAKHDKRLLKLVKNGDIQEIRRRLRKAAKETNFDAARDPLTVARKILESAVISAPGPSEEALHRYRLFVKRARYAAEFASTSSESTEFISQLKKLQDALGHWHDWITLTHTAVEHFGEVNESSLVAALQNVTRGKFRQAISTLPVTSPAGGRKTALVADPAKHTQSAA
jgi:CHAD domain-containing protein